MLPFFLSLPSLSFLCRIGREWSVSSSYSGWPWLLFAVSLNKDIMFFLLPLIIIQRKLVLLACLYGNFPNYSCSCGSQWKNYDSIRNTTMMTHWPHSSGLDNRVNVHLWISILLVVFKTLYLYVTHCWKKMKEKWSCLIKQSAHFYNVWYSVSCLLSFWPLTRLQQRARHCRGGAVPLLSSNKSFLI